MASLTPIRTRRKAEVGTPGPAAGNGPGSGSTPSLIEDVVAMVLCVGSLLAFLALFGGCVPSPIVRHPGASGRDAVTIRCNYMGRSEGECFADADRECPSGYDVVRLDQRGAAGMVTLTVRCK